MKKIIPFVATLPPVEIKLWLDVLAQALPNFQISLPDDIDAGYLKNIEVAIVADPDPGDLKRMPNLKWVQSLWAGVERLVAELPNRTFEIARLTDPQLAVDMGEAVLAWTLYLHRSMPEYRVQQAKKIWQHLPLALPSQRCVGILGLGKLGRVAAERLLANGFDVCGWSRSLAVIDGVNTFAGEDGFAEVVKRSNTLVVLLPLTDKTRGLLNGDVFSMMPKGASVINFARGPIIDDGALLKALDDGRLSHAVLDVFDVEPLPHDNLLWQHRDVTVLPHISARTNYQTASLLAGAHISRFFETRELPDFVDRSQGY